MLKRCPKCKGTQKYTGLGMMVKDCDECIGGFVEDGNENIFDQVKERLSSDVPPVFITSRLHDEEPQPNLPDDMLTSLKAKIEAAKR